MRQYGIFHAPVMAFYSLNFYRDVGMHWHGKPFLYLLILLAICWFPFFVSVQYSLHSYVENKVPKLLSQFPRITVTNGEAAAEVPQPYKIADPDTGRTLVLIDTAGATTTLEGSVVRVLLTRTSLSVRKNSNEISTTNLKGIGHFSTDKQRISRWVPAVDGLVGIVIYLFILVGAYAYRVVQTIIYAVIGLLFAKICRVRLTYQTLLDLSLMAITPVIIIGTILSWTPYKFPYAGLFYFIMAMAYLFMGVKESARQEEGQYPDTKTRQEQLDKESGAERPLDRGQEGV